MGQNDAKSSVKKKNCNFLLFNAAFLKSTQQISTVLPLELLSLLQEPNVGFKTSLDLDLSLSWS